MNKESSSPTASSSQTKQEQQPASNNDLLTPKAHAMALSPPRVPPHGSLHRNVLLGGGGNRRRRISQQQQHKQPFAEWPRHYHVTEERYIRHNELDSDNNEKQGEQQQQQSPRRPHPRFQQRLARSHHEAPLHNRAFGYHPHLPLAPEWGDQMTRFLGVTLPLEFHNSVRDSGAFRTISDSLITAMAPMMVMAAPSMAWAFVQNTLRMTTIQYGTHKSQYIQLYLPPPPKPTRDQQQQQPPPSPGRPPNPTPPRRMIVFVHGGAWGSGMPWMYRLVANPKFLNQQQWAVAVIGYRTYPDGFVADQVQDCLDATTRLAIQYPNTPMTLMGHSSGAHIALIMLIDHVIAQLELATAHSHSTTTRTTRIAADQTNNAPHNVQREVRSSDKDRDSTTPSDSSSSTTTTTTNITAHSPCWRLVDSFVGLSGPYDIVHHYDYEAARGVEELSPMKPCCGYTRDNFRINSPAQRLVRALADYRGSCVSNNIDNNDKMMSSNSSDSTPTLILEDLIPPIALIHGVHDDTVPFTTTGETARILRSCGIKNCDEIYLADTIHQDTAVHLMLGGKTLDAILDWIVHRISIIDQQGAQNDPTSRKGDSSSLLSTASPRLIARSRL